MDWFKKASSPVKKLYLMMTMVALAMLSACGGSGGGFVDDGSSGGGGGGTGGGSATTTVAVAITSTSVDAANPATVTATVNSSSGGAVAGVVVSFNTTLGVINPESGTALTDANGEATIILSAGTISGAGTVTAAINTGESGSIGFTTAGDGSVELVSLSLALLDSAGQPTSNISGASPGTLEATFLNGGNPVSGILVTFILTGGVGELNPASGTALTNANGVASIILQSGDDEGAGQVSASVSGGITDTIAFSVSISATDVAMTTPIVNPGAIGANGTATVEVTITETSGGVTTPINATVSVQFTSACVQNGTATLDTDVDTISGVARSTYKDQGCGILDTINVSATVGQTLLTQSATIDVQPATAGSISFISANPTNIALRGTGGSGRSETSTVTFRVIDDIGLPVIDTAVNFALTTSVGDITINPDTSAQTDSNGEVDVIVQSGTIPTPVRIVATLASDPTISTVSDELVISTGVADFNSLSLSASNLNPEAWSVDGTISTITARVADHFNNPVPDGTAVAFTTEFGSIEPSCTTTNGVCSVDWTSQSPRVPTPAFRDSSITITRQIGDVAVSECIDSAGADTNLNAAGFSCFYGNSVAATGAVSAFFGGLGQAYGNRVSIRATVLGEESFTDSNANGQYDAGEAFTDLTEAFIDDNEDDVFGGKLGDGTPAAGAASAADPGCYDPDTTSPNTNSCFQVGGDNEEFVDFDSDQIFDQGNGVYNGVLCPVGTASTVCTRELLTIWKNITLLQADSSAVISMIESGLNREDSANYFQGVTLPATVIAYVSDFHNGIMPSGTVIEFDAGNGVIVGPNRCIVGQTSAFGINSCAVAINPDTQSNSGPLVVSVTTPGGITTVRSISTSD